jgi:hypothetical protein
MVIHTETERGGERRERGEEDGIQSGSQVRNGQYAILEFGDSRAVGRRSDKRP